MANINTTWTLDERGLLSGMTKISSRLDELESQFRDVQKANDKAFGKGAKSAQDFEKSLRRTNTGISTTVASLSKLATAAGVAFAAIGIGAQIRDAGRLAISYEQLRVSFETFLGSAEQAEKVLGRLNEFSLSTPFTPDQVNEAGKALLAFGITSDDLIPSLKAIGDIAAGTGKDFNELSVIYGKARTQGRLFAEDINQLTEAGIPIIDEFAQQFGVAADEVKKLASDGKISFENLEQGFASLTGEGGRFFNLMEEQSQTVGGRLSTLQGNFDNLKRELGEQFLPALSDTVNALNEFVQALDVQAVLNFFSPVSDKLIPALESVYDALVDLVDQIFGFNNESERTEAVVNALQTAFDVTVSVMSSFVDIVALAVRGITAVYENSLLLQGAVDLVKETFRLAGAAISEFLEAIDDIISVFAKQEEAQKGVETATRASRGAFIQNTESVKEYKKAAEALNKEIEKTPGASGQAAAELSKITKEYEKLLDVLTRDADAAALDSLTGVDRLQAERTEALAQVEAFANEIRTKAAQIGRDLPADFEDNIQELVKQIESEFAKGVQELRSDNIAIDLLPDTENQDGEAYGRSLAESVTKGLAQGAEEGGFQALSVFEKLKFNILDALGISEEEAQETINAVQGAFIEFTEGITALTEARIQQQERIISALDERIDTQQDALDEELEAQRAGLANSVDTERKKLKQLQLEREKQEKKRLAFEKKAAKQRLLLDTAQQVSGLVTMAANVARAESGKGLLGVALAIAAVASFFRLFSQAKAQAQSAASDVELRGGGRFDDHFLMSHETQRATGKKHRIGNSRYTIEKGEWIVNRDASSEHDEHIRRLNDGKYTGVDLVRIFENGGKPLLDTPAITKRIRASQHEYDSLRRGTVSVDLGKKIDATNKRLDAFMAIVQERPVVVPPGSQVTKHKKMGKKTRNV